MTAPFNTRDVAASLFARLGFNSELFRHGNLVSVSPIDGSEIGKVEVDAPHDVASKITAAHAAFGKWRSVPAPKRGELVRLFGEELRRNKEPLAELVSLEVGKIRSEGLGEVQEMIDICDFAVGLSRQLYGLTIATERLGHRMMETWHPLGVVGIISAFNFPVAVWAWNACLALVCGNSLIWKPSEKTPLSGQAAHALLDRVIAGFECAPKDLSTVIQGDWRVGQQVVDSPLVSLVSATGSTKMGKEIAPRVASRFGRSILELGGNNAMIVTPTADLELAVRAIAFSAVGTAGQRCTTLRRLFVHESLYEELLYRLIDVFARVKIGNPLDPKTLVGPLIDQTAFEGMENALARARAEGGKVHGGGRAMIADLRGGYYVQPAIVEMPAQSAVIRRETFAPILYVLRYKDIEEAIALNNDVPQGLSSSILTRDLGEAEQFLSSVGSDCGIANVNIGPSGAEIGGAFGGEKETGGGRESGSDSWRAYMRRATNTINYSRELPLAQGVEFEV